jgi:hypothetical protein
MEGPHQRPGHGRQLRRAPRAAHRPPAADRHAEPGHAGGLRVAGPDHAAVHRRHCDLGSYRSAHHGEPGAPATRVGPVHAGRLQERDGRRRPGRRGRVPRVGRRAHVLRRHGGGGGSGRDDQRQRGHARDLARRPDWAQLLRIARGEGAGPGRRGRVAAPPHGGRQPREQRQGLPPSARRGRGAGGADRRRRARGLRRDA